MKETKRTQGHHACAQCDAVLGQASDLRKHVRTVHEKRKDYACPHCAAAFGTASTVLSHVRAVHEKRRDHACSQCDTAFGKASNLRTHVRTVHEQRRDHACSQCDAAFGEAGTLSRHVRTVHEQRRDHACPQCNAAFGKASNLSRHARAMHPPDAPSSFECPLCSAAGANVTFGDVRAGLLGFAAHVHKQHSGESGAHQALIARCGYTCDLCSSEKPPFTCKGIRDMIEHKAAVHKKMRGFSCPHCTAAFAVSRTLSAHIKAVHEKKKEHECNYAVHDCKAAFAKGSDLARHVRTVHEKRRDHACGYCDGVAFGTADTLKRHISAIHLKIKRSRGAK